MASSVPVCVFGVPRCLWLWQDACGCILYIQCTACTMSHVFLGNAVRFVSVELHIAVFGFVWLPRRCNIILGIPFWYLIIFQTD